MAEHARKQIRDAFAHALRKLPRIGANVFPGRATPLDPNELPGAVVSTARRDGERSAIDDDGGSIGGPVTIARVLPVSVIAIAQATSDSIEDVLDDLALEVEQAVDAELADASSDLAGLVKDALLVNSQVIISADAPGTGEIRLAYEVKYLTVRGAPETAVQ